ncbi:MAG TPA: hypothetical protein DEP27_03690, partial [Ruminococcaceae bacterium]|nr:hypothetical protein [Oscillospiraceae bacterium]
DYLLTTFVVYYAFWNNQIIEYFGGCCLCSSVQWHLWIMYSIFTSFAVTSYCGEEMKQISSCL